MVPAPAIVCLELSVDLSEKIMSTLYVLDCRSFAAHEGIPHQQIGEAGSNCPTAE